MPKIIDYPRASLRNALMLAQAVDELGGTCALESAADKLGKKGGGAFAALVSAAVKYGLITAKKGRLSVDALYRDYKLAYSEQEQQQVAVRALLSVPVFQKIYERFKDQKLPVDHLDKLLIREFDVSDDAAARVATYFVDGGRLSGLVNEDFSFNFSTGSADADANEVVSAGRDTKERDAPKPVDSEFANIANEFDASRNSQAYSIRVQGPGIDSVIVVNDEDDLVIVRTIIKKIEKKFAEKVAVGRTTAALEEE